MTYNLLTPTHENIDSTTWTLEYMASQIRYMNEVGEVQYEACGCYIMTKTYASPQEILKYAPWTTL